jgi:peptidoglycan biosynthesis protein MviN/MurJ (putative lipid II flippase)
MPQYRIPQEEQGRRLEAQADQHFKDGEHAGSTSDKYIRITVFLATVLFLIGISSHFPRHSGRYGLIALASVLLVVSVVQLLSLPGPPA